MKMAMLFAVATAGGLLIGCSNEKDRQAAMQKSFSAIDSNFVASLAEANSNEQWNIQNQQASFSNKIMSLHLPLTNIEIAANELSIAMSQEFTKTVFLMNIAEETCELQRARATNRMLLAKLNWFYTNSMPLAENAPSNDIGAIVTALATDLSQQRRDEILKAGLNQITQALSNGTNTPRPLTKLEQQQLYIETTSVKKTAVRIVGDVFQVTDNGMLIRYNYVHKAYGADDYQFAFVQDQNPNEYAEGDKLNGLIAYPVGTYRYDTKGGDTKTVRRFTVSLDRALEWKHNPQ
jgi:hypothetical protein